MYFNNNQHTYNQSSIFSSQNMSIERTLFKSAFLLIVSVLSAVVTLNLPISTMASFFNGTYLWIFLISTFGISSFIIKRPLLAKILAPIYALMEGFILAYFVSILELLYPGIFSQALPLTMGLILTLILLHSSKTIRVTSRYIKIVYSLLGAVSTVYFLDFALMLFGYNISFLHEASILSLIFSAFVLAVASFHILIDFEAMIYAHKTGESKELEWYFAFKLLASVIFIFIRVLDFLSILRKRRNF